MGETKGGREREGERKYIYYIIFSFKSWKTTLARSIPLKPGGAEGGRLLWEQEGSLYIYIYIFFFIPERRALEVYKSEGEGDAPRFGESGVRAWGGTWHTVGRLPCACRPHLSPPSHGRNALNSHPLTTIIVRRVTPSRPCSCAALSRGVRRSMVNLRVRSLQNGCPAEGLIVGIAGWVCVGKDGLGAAQT